MGSHIVDGQFQSDKYPTCPPGKVPLSVKDESAQDILWLYAQRRRAVDAEFAHDLEQALIAAGYSPPSNAVMTKMAWSTGDDASGPGVSVVLPMEFAGRQLCEVVRRESVAYAIADLAPEAASTLAIAILIALHDATEGAK